MKHNIPPLRWINNDLAGAEFAFRNDPGYGPLPFHFYSGAPIHADFELTLDNLAPFVTEVLDQAAVIEAAGLEVKLVEIKDGKVKVW